MGGEVRIASLAAKDLAGIWEFVAKDSPEQADKLIQAILETADKLLALPKLGRRRDDLLRGSRSIGEGGYLIFYEIVRGEVRVSRVVHGSRNLAKVLKQKK